MKQLRKNALRLVVVFCALFVLVSVYAVYLVSANESRLLSSTYNVYAREQRSRAVRGNILDRNGVLLATSDSEDSRIYHDDPLIRAATVHAVGIQSSKMTSSAEYMFSAYLYGLKLSFPERFSYLIRNEKPRGDNVTLTIDSRLAAFVSSVFPEGKKGAVVVMNYKTGEILTIQSFPSFDPQGAQDVSSTLTQNAATQTLKAPGSTFKIVTAAAVIRTVPDYADLTFTCSGAFRVRRTAAQDGSYQILPVSVALENEQSEKDYRIIRDAGNQSHGKLTLRQAFAKSCNNTFASLALSLGDDTLRKTAEDFGFNDNFLFRDLVVENSSYPTENRDMGEIAWTGAGQSQLTATPLHMCLIAAAVANDGVMMEPRMLVSVSAASGRQRAAGASRVYRTPLTQEQAAVLKDYMYAVVNETGGTGVQAAIAGKRVCGKTGSAELDNQEKTNAWFVGFLAEPDAPYALAIMIENAGGGGSEAAPRARRIFSWLLENETVPEGYAP